MNPHWCVWKLMMPLTNYLLLSLGDVYTGVGEMLFREASEKLIQFFLTAHGARTELRGRPKEEKEERM